MATGDAKVCSRCKVSKPASEFNRYERSKDGLQPTCRSCQAAWYREHAEQTKANAHRRRVVWRVDAQHRMLAYLAEHPCVDCGEADPVVLEFDHVRGKKEAMVSRLVMNGASWRRIEEEIAKCEVRCANCHRRRSAVNGGYYRAFVAQPDRAAAF